MPYISVEDRKLLDEIPMPATVGELNYLITRLCCDYLLTGKMSYRALNDVIGALECAKLELYRRIVVPYEQGKMDQNGDVYPYFGKPCESVEEIDLSNCKTEEEKIARIGCISKGWRGENNGPDRQHTIQTGQTKCQEVQ